MKSHGLCRLGRPCCGAQGPLLSVPRFPGLMTASATHGDGKFSGSLLTAIAANCLQELGVSLPRHLVAR